VPYFVLVATNIALGRLYVRRYSQAAEPTATPEPAAAE
jgi:hypothetical protein